MSLTVEEARQRIGNMQLSELRAEALAHYKSANDIEKKYPNGPITDKADQDQVKSLLTVTDLLEDALQPLEEAAARKERITSRMRAFSTPAERMSHPQITSSRDNETKTIGERFLADAQYKALRDSGVLGNRQSHVEITVPLPETSLINWKALLVGGPAGLGPRSGGGSLVVPDFRPGAVQQLFRQLTILDLVPRGTTQSDVIEYVREDAYTNAAAFTAEATATSGTTGTKPESTLAFSQQTANVRTLANWIPVTNRLLADAPAIRDIIDNRLLMFLDLILDTQVTGGDGTGENFTGILSTAGIQIQGLGADNRLDAIMKARTLIRINGLAMPDAVVLHPTDYQTARLTREGSGATTGGYLMGPATMAGPGTIFGMPVAESLGLSQGTGLVGAFQMGCMLFDREEAAIRVGYINDQFVRNMQTILAELRAAFVVWRPTAFAKVTGL